MKLLYDVTNNPPTSIEATDGTDILFIKVKLIHSIIPYSTMKRKVP